MTQTATRKKPERRLSFNRQVGALFLTIGSKEFGYYLDRLASQLADRPIAVRLTKFRCQQEDGKQDLYDVAVGPKSASCECLGWLKHSHCKHIDAVRCLSDRGSL